MVATDTLDPDGRGYRQPGSDDQSLILWAGWPGGAVTTRLFPIKRDVSGGQAQKSSGQVSESERVMWHFDIRLIGEGGEKRVNRYKGVLL